MQRIELRMPKGRSKCVFSFFLRYRFVFEAHARLTNIRVEGIFSCHARLPSMLESFRVILRSGFIRDSASLQPRTFLYVCSPMFVRKDYKVNPEGAQPYATISMYSDLVESKELGLIRADITPNLTKKVKRRLYLYRV